MTKEEEKLLRLMGKRIRELRIDASFSSQKAFAYDANTQYMEELFCLEVNRKIMENLPSLFGWRFSTLPSITIL